MWEQVWRDECVKYKTYSIVPIAENTCLYAKKVNEATNDLVSQLHGVHVQALNRRYVIGLLILMRLKWKEETPLIK